MMSEAYSEPYKRLGWSVLQKKYTPKISELFSQKRSILCFTEFWIGLWMLKFIFSPIFNISKLRTLMQKKVRGDQAPSCVVFAKPDISFKMFSSMYFFMV